MVAVSRDREALGEGLLLTGMNKEFLTRCIHPKDLLNEDCVAGNWDTSELVQRAETIVKYGFAALTLEPIKIKGKLAHRIRSTPHAVVLRALNRIIRQATKIEPSDRDTIVRRLKTILAEGVQHRVYKFDIKSFFESLDTNLLFVRLANLPLLPRHATLVLQNYLK